jgi:hypothetical protein
VKRGLTAVLAGALLLTTGCGGGSGGGTRHEDPSTSFRKQADAICATTFAQLQASTKEVADRAHPTRAELTDLARKTVSHLTDERDALAALRPPASLRAGVTTVLASLQQVIDVAGRKGPAFFAPGTTPFAQLGADANAVGLTDCAF